MKSIKQWLKRALAIDRRRSARRNVHGVHAHYWNGGPPRARGVVEISGTGLFIATDERWYPGTLVTMTLQIAGCAEDDPHRSISVQGKVVREEADGMAFEFVAPKSKGWKFARKKQGEESPEEVLRKFLVRAGYDAKEDEAY